MLMRHSQSVIGLPWEVLIFVVILDEKNKNSNISEVEMHAILSMLHFSVANFTALFEGRRLQAAQNEANDQLKVYLHNK